MSEKPLAERLQVKAGRSLAVVGAPEELDAAIGVHDRRAPAGSADVVLVFVRDRKALDAALPELLAEIRSGAILWLAYPKLTSPLAADLSRDGIHQLVPAYGLSTVAQVAVDADWSALRFKRVD